MRVRKSWRTVKVSLVRETGQPFPMRSGQDVAGLVRSFLAEDPRERFVVVYLDTKHRPIAVHTASIGTADCASVHPREIYCPAIALAATAIIVAHNHPSGDPSPSSADQNVTDRLRDVGSMLGIPMLDHIVLGSERYYSFAEGAFFSWS